MELFIASIYGLVQGLTEFLPVSSSGHLVILHRLLPLKFDNEVGFDVILHLGTLLAVVYFFRHDISKLLISWLKSFNNKTDQQGRLSWLIILATIPAALAGYFFNGIIENSLRSPYVVIFMLAAVGGLFLVLERIGKKTDDYIDLNWKKALVIGLAQVIALIPGTSRSGITIIAGLGSGLKREAAVKFSFLLSIPIIAGAAAASLPGIFANEISTPMIGVLTAGFLASAISGLVAIKFFMSIAKNISLSVFAVYRFALALVLLIYFFIIS